MVVLQPCAPCVPGTQVAINGNASGFDFDSGNATVNGSNLGVVHWGDNEAYPGTLFNVVGPAITLNAGPGIYRSSFSFNGVMCGTTGSDSTPRPCIANIPNLSGSGYVDVTLTPDSVGNYLFAGAVYTFTATPEPQAWILASLGIMVVLAWRRKVASGQTLSDVELSGSPVADRPKK